VALPRFRALHVSPAAEVASKDCCKYESGAVSETA
jgi:hypothetical protein